MKNLSIETANEMFNEFALTNEEMICVKGGCAGEPIIIPTPPTPEF